MNIIREKSNFIRQNFIFYLSGFLIVLGIKYFYSKAGSDDLLWILAPTTRWVELLSGIPFEYEPGAGYVNHSLRFLIAPSCSGVQFMIITIAMLIFSFMHRIGSGARCALRSSKSCQRLLRICWIPLCVLLSYPLTVFINGLRIIVAMHLPVFLDKLGMSDGFLNGLGMSGGFLTPDRLHTIIGITVYFISLLAIYRFADSVVPDLETPKPTSCHFAQDSIVKQPDPAACGKIHFARKFLPPLFWYFSIALGIPFLNRAYQKNDSQFSEYTILIVSVCAAILILYYLASLIRKLITRKTEHPTNH